MSSFANSPSGSASQQAAQSSNPAAGDNELATRTSAVDLTESEKHSINVHTLTEYIDQHDFRSPSRHEQGFFDQERFMSDDLREAMLYAFETAVKAATAYKKLALSFKDPMEVGIVTLQTFADREGGDTNPENVMPFDSLGYENFKEIKVGEKFKRTLAALAKVRKTAERRTRRLEKESPGVQGLEMLKNWVRSDERMNAQPKRTPLFLNDPQFTERDLIEAACYAKNRVLKWQHKYKRLRDMARLNYSEETLRNVRILEDAELEEAQVTHPEMLPWWKVDNAQMRSARFVPIDGPWPQELTKFQDRHAMYQNGKTREEAFAVWNAEEVEEEVRNVRRGPHKRFGWSLAMLAKNAKIAEKQFKELDRQLNKLEGAVYGDDKADEGSTSFDEDLYS